MEGLHDFFRALDGFVLDSLRYMADGFFGSYDYREGFVAGIVFLVLVVIAGSVAPYVIRRFRVFFGPRPPSLIPGAPPADLFSGCVGAGLIVVVLFVLFLGMIWGLT